MNIILIGMPGAGKSTIGRTLAKRLSYSFIDTDDSIRELEGCSLQNIIDEQGYGTLKEIEEKALCNLALNGHIIATGGSAVYSRKAMDHLKQKGVVVFLDVDLPILKARINDYETRGLVKRPDQNLKDLFKERNTLYRTYTDILVECSHMTEKEVIEEILLKFDRLRQLLHGNSSDSTALSKNQKTQTHKTSTKKK